MFRVSYRRGGAKALFFLKRSGNINIRQNFPSPFFLFLKAKATCGATSTGSELEASTHSIVGVKDVRRGRIVQDERLAKVSAQPAQIFHVAALVEDARLPEEAGPEHAMPVQQIRHGVGVLARSQKAEDAR